LTADQALMTRPTTTRSGGDDDHAEGDDGDAGGETVIAFADETEGEPDDTPLVKRLRDQLRDAQRTIAKNRRTPAANDTDPEPTIRAKPRIEEFDYDQDKFDAALDARDAEVTAHAEWKSRAKERETAGSRAAEEQARQLEQQRKTLGVGDYEERSATVKDRLTDAQLGILINGAQNPARLIYALGRSPAKLDQLAGEDNLARFAVMLGSLEKDIKVIKRNAPAADTAVRGGTASALASIGQGTGAAREGSRPHQRP
jgi:hypothetical protein